MATAVEPAAAEDNNDEPVGRVLGLSLIELREPIVDTSREWVRPFTRGVQRWTRGADGV